MNLTSMDRWSKLVLAMFLNKELFWINNKAIIEFGFRIIWRIMEISEAVFRLGLRPRRITPSSIFIILHKILSLIVKLWEMSKWQKAEHLTLFWYRGPGELGNNLCPSLRSKRFQSSYCAKVRAEAKKRFCFFLLLSQLSRRTSRGNACYAGYLCPGACFSKVQLTFRARKVALCLPRLHSRLKLQQFWK